MSFKNIKSLDALLKQSSQLKHDFPKNMGGSCMLAAEMATRKLVREGINDFIIIEGYISFPNGDPDNPLITHTWIEFSDGTKIDDTLDQFKAYGFNPDEVNYREEGRTEYLPKKYLDLRSRVPSWY